MMADDHQALPTEDTAAGELARQLARLLGPAYQAGDTSRVAADLLALGAALADTRATTTGTLDDAFVDATTHLLDEWEARLGLAPGIALATADRQARLVAKVRAAFGGQPDQIAAACDALGGAGTTDVAENSVADVATTDLRGVFQFAVRVDTTTALNPQTVAVLQAIVDGMKPAHTRGSVTDALGFLCDDPYSLTNLTVL